jgi:hypothetical protein
LAYKSASGIFIDKPIAIIFTITSSNSLHPSHLTSPHLTSPHLTPGVFPSTIITTPTSQSSTITELTVLPKIIANDPRKAFDRPNPVTKVSEDCKRRIVRHFNKNKFPARDDIKYWYWYFNGWDELKGNVNEYIDSAPKYIQKLIDEVTVNDFSPPTEWLTCPRRDPPASTNRRFRLIKPKTSGTTAKASKATASTAADDIPKANSSLAKRSAVTSLIPPKRHKPEMTANTHKAAMAKRLKIPIPDKEKEENIMPPNDFIHTKQLKSDPDPKRVIFSGVDDNGVMHYIYNWSSKGQPLNPTFDSDSNYIYTKPGYTVT